MNVPSIDLPCDAGPSLYEMVDLAGTTAAGKSERRLHARQSALATLRELEARLRAALGGHRLQLPNLLSAAAVPFFGVRIRGRYPADGLPVDGHPVLVLAADGSLVRAWRVVPAPGEAPVAEWAPATDDDLKAEDLVGATRRMYNALAEHVARAQRGEARYAEVADLAARLRRALDA